MKYKCPPNQLLVILLLAFCSILPLHAHTNAPTTQQLMWFGLNTKFELKKNWHLGWSIQDRRYVFPGKQHQLITDLNAGYKSKLGIRHDLTFNAGMVFFIQSSDDPRLNDDFFAPEFRPHWSVTYNRIIDPEEKLQLSIRAQTEYRLRHLVANNELADGYFFQVRYRFLVKGSFRLLQRDNDKLFIIISAEPMIQVADATENNKFDQHRSYGALKYQFGKRTAAEAGYLHWYQKTAGGSQYWSRHMVVWTLYYNIKKAPPPPPDNPAF